MPCVLDDGELLHVECGLKYVAVCERGFSPDDVDRESWHNRAGDESREVCPDCEASGRSAIIDRL